MKKWAVTITMKPYTYSNEDTKTIFLTIMADNAVSALAIIEYMFSNSSYGNYGSVTRILIDLVVEEGA